MLATPSTVITMTEIDFTKYANAIGAIYRRNKDLEHINLLEATSAKESKGMNGYLLALGASCVGAVVLVGAITLGLGAFDNAIKSQISDVQQQINNPTLQNDLEIVSNREKMLAGFQKYNDSVGETSQLFNYMPKAQSYVIDKLKEPIDSIVNDDVELDLLSVSISDYSVSATFMGRSNGDPTPIPSDYVEKLIKDVKTKYGDSYFQNVSYSGFQKVNSSLENNYLVLSTEKEKYDTVFTFSLSMNIRAGSDEENATSIDLDPQPVEEEEVAE